MANKTMSNFSATGITEDSVLRWPHLTDLHVGIKNECQQTAPAPRVTAITALADNKSFDLVLLTGDAAYSGHREEYHTLQSQLIQSCKANPLFNTAEFHAVPGNPDVNCDNRFPRFLTILVHQDKLIFFTSMKLVQMSENRSMAPLKIAPVMQDLLIEKVGVL